MWLNYMPYMKQLGVNYLLDNPKKIINHKVTGIFYLMFLLKYMRSVSKP